jgi:hypothetical protein
LAEITGRKTAVKKTIEVTREDIIHGTPQNAWYCPVSNAVHRALLETCRTGGTYITVKGQNLYLPNDVTKRIRDYDLGEGMKPFSFELEVPDDWK